MNHTESCNVIAKTKRAWLKSACKLLEPTLYVKMAGFGEIVKACLHVEIKRIVSHELRASRTILKSDYFMQSLDQYKIRPFHNSQLTCILGILDRNYDLL